MTTRRRLLAAAAGSAAGAAGCLCDDTRRAPLARLEFADGTRAGPVAGDWVIDGGVVAEFLLSGDDPTLGFHDVRVTVESEDGAVMGRTDLGDFERGDADESTFCGWNVLRRSLRMRVDAFPYRILLWAEERDYRCEEDAAFDVEVDSAFFNHEHYDVGHSGPLARYWTAAGQPCFEGDRDR